MPEDRLPSWLSTVGEHLLERCNLVAKIRLCLPAPRRRRALSPANAQTQRLRIWERIWEQNPPKRVEIDESP